MKPQVVVTLHLSTREAEGLWNMMWNLELDHESAEGGQTRAVRLCKKVRKAIDRARRGHGGTER